MQPKQTERGISPHRTAHLALQVQRPEADTPHRSGSAFSLETLGACSWQPAPPARCPCGPMRGSSSFPACTDRPARLRGRNLILTPRGLLSNSPALQRSSLFCFGDHTLQKFPTNKRNRFIGNWGIGMSLLNSDEGRGPNTHPGGAGEDKIFGFAGAGTVPGHEETTEEKSLVGSGPVNPTT